MCGASVLLAYMLAQRGRQRWRSLFFKTRRFIDLTLYFMGDELWKKQLKNL